MHVQRRTGLFLVTLTVVGVALIVVPLYRAVLGGSTSLEELRPGGKVPLELMFGGLGLCLIAWVWALFSCMALWKRVRG